uniref:Uncharacterized protein n=1 Tax=Panagrolaimus superbus TaxID=310955 RepID=A0A914YG89_9BILA
MMTDRPKCSAHRKLNVKTNNNNEIPCDSELCHDFSRLSHSEEEIPSELPSKAKSVIKPRSKDELKRTVSFAKFDNLVEYSSEKWMGTSRDVVSKSNKFHDSPIAYKRFCFKT